MNYNGRKKDNIKNGLILLIGLVCLWGLTMNLRSAEAAIEEMDTDEIVSQTIITEEKNIEIEVNELYQSMGQAVEVEEIRNVVMQVLGDSYFPEIEIDGKGQFYSVTIIYDETNKDQVLSKAKKEQVALVNACLLMSLFNDIDDVTTRNVRGETYDEKVIYRPDIEDYFGISLEAANHKNTFTRIANEFLSSEAVDTYWSMKHPYDSQLGEVVEKFYKCNFPSKWEEEETFPYVDETLGADLVEQYGYKFFIQGLNYEHPLMNYYAAYRLVEYYGDRNLDEILLELASCKNKSDNKEVQAACTWVMNILSSHLEEDEVFVFTRYSKSELQGDRKLYGLVGEKLVELASWQGEQPGGFEVISVSNNKKSVLCKIHTLEESYLYMIPIDTIGGYVVNESAVQRGEEIISRELTNLIKEIGSQDESNLQSKWLFQNVLVLSASEGKSFVYDGDKDSLLDEDTFNQTFDTAYLVKGLKEKFENITEKEIIQDDEKYQIKEIDINNEKLLVYEYDSRMQKHMDLLKEEHEEASIEKQWSKGKIYVTYKGIQSDIISALNKLMVD